MWRTLVFLVALGALILITTRWNRWESNAHLQTTHDDYRATVANRQLQVLAAQQAQAEATLAAQKASLAVARINLGYTRIVAKR